eukprot:6235081-Amphidinium_carterae.1
MPSKYPLPFHFVIFCCCPAIALPACLNCFGDVGGQIRGWTCCVQPAASCPAHHAMISQAHQTC